MLVPWKTAHSAEPRPGTEERIPTPGALTSGLNESVHGVGPPEEKSATMPGGVPRVLVTAPTVIAFGALPGEEIEPGPNSSKSFPAATTGTTPASAAAPSAFTTMSRLGSIAGSPSERLITSIPSRTAASIPAVISGELPSSPKPGVGTVKTR